MTKKALEFSTELDVPGFISKEAHDLRSPFNRIMGFTKLVLNGMDGPITDLQKEDLTTVYKNSAHALTLMNLLVDAARFSLHEKKVSIGEVEINHLSGQAVAHWQQHHPMQDIRVETQISEKITTVRGDEILLRQLISYVIAFVSAYVKEPAKINLQVQFDKSEDIFIIRSEGEREQVPASGELEVLGYVCQAILGLHEGKFQTIEEDENGAVIQFSLPKISS